jgi:hypothetical protein
MKLFRRQRRKLLSHICEHHAVSRVEFLVEIALERRFVDGVGDLVFAKDDAADWHRAAHLGNDANFDGAVHPRDVDEICGAVLAHAVVETATEKFWWRL